MKRYLVSTVVILVVLAAAWTVFGQSQAGPPRFAGHRDWRMFRMLPPEEAAEMRQKWQSMSDEEKEQFRAQMRERWENMSDEEKEKIRGRTRDRTISRNEGQLKAIKAIEGQLERLKAIIESAESVRQGRFSSLSEEERAKLREGFMKANEQRQTALKAIIEQVAVLQGSRRPATGQEFIIVNAGELNAIRELALKEKAEETAKHLGRIVKGRRIFEDRPQRPRPRLRPTIPPVRKPVAPDAKGDEQKEVIK
jgi:hypothetical protein